jgi:hypothetical protein
MIPIGFFFREHSIHGNEILYIVVITVTLNKGVYRIIMLS